MCGLVKYSILISGSPWEKVALWCCAL